MRFRRSQVAVNGSKLQALQPASYGDYGTIVADDDVRIQSFL
jgi:hypothetical protein